MLKKLSLIFLLAVGLSACKKNNNSSGCGVKTCTAEYVSFGIIYTDSQDRTITVKDVTVINLRTKKPVTPPPYPPAIDYIPNFQLIASDSNKDEFSSTGDDVQITATNTATGQIKTTILKISGGCNCHVAKLSGPDKLLFD